MAFVVAGAATIGLWIDARVPRAMPERKELLAFHFLLALVVLGTAPVAMAFIPGADREAGPATVALIGIFLPALAYTFLSAVWIMRAAQRALLRA